VAGQSCSQGGDAPAIKAGRYGAAVNPNYE